MLLRKEGGRNKEKKHRKKSQRKKRKKRRKFSHWKSFGKGKWKERGRRHNLQVQDWKHGYHI
jgi:Ni/Co efflux regulator RcnB